MNITLLTCTGDRPQPLSLCRHFINRSTRQPQQWLVVDDGAVPSKDLVTDFPGSTYVRRIPNPQTDPSHTLPVNILAAISHIASNTDWVVFWEDDDWYSSQYLEWLEGVVTKNPTAVLVGQKDAQYYRVMSREYQRMGNDRHASLCATAVHVSLLMDLAMVSSSTIDPFIDIHIWNRCASLNMPVQLLHHPFVVGIKQLPGRQGRTYGWRGGADFCQDPEMKKLAEWVGPFDADIYRRICKGEELCISSS